MSKSKIQLAKEVAKQEIAEAKAEKAEAKAEAKAVAKQKLDLEDYLSDNFEVQVTAVNKEIKVKVLDVKEGESESFLSNLTVVLSDTESILGSNQQQSKPVALTASETELFFSVSYYGRVYFIVSGEYTNIHTGETEVKEIIIPYELKQE